MNIIQHILVVAMGAYSCKIKGAQVLVTKHWRNFGTKLQISESFYWKTAVFLSRIQDIKLQEISQKMTKEQTSRKKNMLVWNLINGILPSSSLCCNAADTVPLPPKCPFWQFNMRFCKKETSHFTMEMQSGQSYLADVSIDLSHQNAKWS